MLDVELTWSAYFNTSGRKAAITERARPFLKGTSGLSIRNTVLPAHVLCDVLCLPNLEVCCLLPCLEVTSTTIEVSLQCD